METTIIAIYENGMLRPLTALPFAERTPVRLRIIEPAIDTDEPVETEVILEHPLLALANLGESQETDVSERVEDILANEIDPQTGWSAPNAKSG